MLHGVRCWHRNKEKDMIEHLQMMQRIQNQEIERSVAERQRFVQTTKPKTRLQKLRHILHSIF